MYIEGKQSNTYFDEIVITANRAGSAGSAFEQESDSHSQSSASELRVKGRLHSSTYSFPGNPLDDQFNDSAFVSILKKKTPAVCMYNVDVTAEMFIDEKNNLLTERPPFKPVV